MLQPRIGADESQNVDASSLLLPTGFVAVERQDYLNGVSGSKNCVFSRHLGHGIPSE